MNANFQPPVQAEPIDSAVGSPSRHAAPWAGPRRAVPSISGLIAFEATARHLSFSRAAHELTLTQGAVSKRVRQLENVLGITLLARSRHQVVLTEPGKRYLTDVRRLLGEIQAATTSLQAGSRRPGITLAAPREIASYWLMPRLSSFQTLCPEIDVNLMFSRPSEGPTQSAGFECAIHCVNGGSVNPPYDALFPEELAPVAAPQFIADHRITTPAALMATPLILQNRRHNQWRDWFAALGLRAEHALEGNSHDCMSLVLEAALNGHGVALVPVQIARDLVAEGRLRIVFDVPRATDRSYVFSVQPAFARHKPVRQFRQWLLDTAREQH